MEEDGRCYECHGKEDSDSGMVLSVSTFSSHTSDSLSWGSPIDQASRTSEVSEPDALTRAYHVTAQRDYTEDEVIGALGKQFGIHVTKVLPLWKTLGTEAGKVAAGKEFKKMMERKVWR